ncbi:DUF5049 domain-containing protein [Lachnospiraceae bacterium 45-W7]
MTETIKKQIEAIRRSGETNMLDVNMVQWIANRKRYYELVVYLEEHREEYTQYLLTGKAEVQKPETEPQEPNATEPKIDPKKTEANLSALFDELVPARGKAGTVAGEIVRAISRIGYRNYNDGDHIGVGYGRETCNAAARYLAKNAGEKAAKDISDIWGVYDDTRYDALLEVLEADVLTYLETHPELKSVPNHEDMFDYTDKYEDVDNGDDGDDEEDW